MARKVAIYTRISRDDEGDGLGVARQRQDCERLADLRGLSVAKIYEDNDVSAYKRNVRRPEFELMLSDLTAGLIDGVVSYDLDRLARQPKDLERLIEVFETRKRLTFVTVTNDIDLSSADGRTMARVMVAFANKSSHDTARRIKRKHLELAMKGKSSGGPSPYGWQKNDPNKVDPEAARHIRDAQKEILADERAAAHARSVIRISTGPDGTEISPMRAAEARLTLGVAAARTGEIEEAIGMGTTALEADRKSLPSLLLVADELDKELRARYPREAASRDFHEQIMTIKRGAATPELPF